jgi:hypothetical protein
MLTVGFLAAPLTASAAYISSFGRTTNDGVFTLTAAQAAFLGTPTADRIGFFRVRAGGTPSVTWSAGDYFDSASVLATVTSNGGAILGLFNGLGDGQLTYASGGLYSPFTSATFNSANTADGELFRAIAFTFNSASGNIVFRGSATFSPATVVGPSDVPTAPPVPLPGAAWLLVSGLAGIGMLGRRRRAAG